MSSVSTCDICDLYKNALDPKMDLRWLICNSYSALLSTAMIMQGLEV